LKIIGIGLLVLTIYLSSCRDESDKKKTGNKRVSPGYASIVGTVTQVEATLDTLSTEKPCGNVPCYAIVRVDSILGYGSSFGNPLVKGSTIRLKFMFTVEKTTKEYFPNLKEHFPGVVINSKLKGNIELVRGSSAVTNEEFPRLYRIFSYQLIE
jgi:hypothetical protein